MARGALADQNRPRSDQARPRVLIVDPDARSRAELVLWLRHPGYAPIDAVSFEEARHWLTTSRIDVLVTALRLGAFNGLHLVIAARGLQPHLRAVVTALEADPGVSGEARQHGAL